MERELKEKGFRQSLEDDVICRWHLDEIILDIMPTDEKILGFGNQWYQEALEHAINYQISDDLIIRSITAPYFISTKIEAFKTRGNCDLLGSHDFEDIVTIIDGRAEIVDEVRLANNNLKLYLKYFFEGMLKNDQFERVLPGHLSNGSLKIKMERARTVMSRIRKIVEIC